MQHLVFTDSSTKDNVAVATAIALTHYSFEGASVRDYTVETPTQGELYAIVQAAELARDLELVGDIQIKSDAMTLLTVGKKILASGEVHAGTLWPELWYKLIDIYDKVKFSLVYTKGHSPQATTNKSCDLLSRTLLTDIYKR